VCDIGASFIAAADLFEERRDAPADLPRREVALYVYGVDVMSTNDLLQYFEAYAPTFVEWINDSSCEWWGGWGRGDWEGARYSSMG
jgi:hypothetical protein